MHSSCYGPVSRGGQLFKSRRRTRFVWTIIGTSIALYAHQHIHNRRKDRQQSMDRTKQRETLGGRRACMVSASAATWPAQPSKSSQDDFFGSQADLIDVLQRMLIFIVPLVRDTSRINDGQLHHWVLLSHRLPWYFQSLCLSGVHRSLLDSAVR